MSSGQSFTCPRCRRTSYHPEDVRHGYCGACHDYAGANQVEQLPTRSEPALAGALRAWDRTIGYSKMERMRAALQAAELDGILAEVQAPGYVAPQVCGDTTGPNSGGGGCVMPAGHPHIDGIGGRWPVTDQTTQAERLLHAASVLFQAEDPGSEEWLRRVESWQVNCLGHLLGHEMPLSAPKVCGLCGHEITLDRCGSASADGVPLCHHDTHSCYHRWTVYGARPTPGGVR